MLGRRIYLNLAAFVVLFVVLMAWALVSVVKPDFVIDSYEVTARFDDVNGIRPDVEVTHRGVRVGRVDSVQLSEGQAVVDLSIDADRDLPDGVHAAVRRRSAVGEPYIALTSPPGWERGDPVVPTDGSYTIPIESTPITSGASSYRPSLYSGSSALRSGAAPSRSAASRHGRPGCTPSARAMPLLREITPRASMSLPSPMVAVL